MAQSPPREGRHARTTAQSPAARRGSDGPPLGILVIIAAVVLGLIAVVAVRAQREDPGSTSAEASAPCADAIGVSAPAELAPLVESYAATGDGCRAATLVASGPADARILTGSEPRVPDAALSEPVGTSPVVLALPEELATALGYPDSALDGAALSEALTPGAWAERGGAAAWGEFRVRVTAPESTTLGATGVSALVGALVGASTASMDDLSAAIGTGSLGRLARALQPAPPEEPLFPDVPDTAGFAASTSAVLTTEAALLAHQSTGPAVPLVGVVVGKGAAHVPLRVRGASDGLLEHLLGEEGQSAIRAAGYYGADGEPPTARGPISADLVADTAEVLDDRQLVAAASLLDAAVRPRDIVVLMDASAGLAEPLEGATTRQAAVAEAAQGVVPAGADVRLSLWLGEPNGPRQSLSPTLATAETLSAVGAAIAGTAPAGAPDLETAIRETLGHSLVYAREPSRELVLLVIVPAGRELADDQESRLITYLRSAVRPDQQVRVSILSVGGPSPDLDAIAAAGQGLATSATSLAELPGALTSAVVGH